MEPWHDSSSALLTDLYQLTMAAGYWQCGMAEHEAVFDLFFRRNPFGSGFSLAAGLAPAVAWLQALRFADDDLAYLETLRGNDGRPLFAPRFLDHLQTLKLRIDLDAIPEGTVVFPHEPLVRVRGPLLQAQLLETPLLNLINFPTLIATKAARVCQAAGNAPVLEFGLRRAQGLGGLAASRAAYLGGCAGTSNVLAGKRYGIPVKGTHAHSWVMAFPTEDEAFLAYARALPNNCTFLVDTYDTSVGVANAIRVGQFLREQGQAMIGVRLDSGDLLALSRAARQQLDAAGFADALIVASNDLDEYEITRLKAAGAPIDVFGVGTRLATAFDEPALGGVYKLAAIADARGQLRATVKLSADPAKASSPGVRQVRRFRDPAGNFLADVIYDQEQGAPVLREGACTLVTKDGTLQQIAGIAAGEDLLEPVLRRGQVVAPVPDLAQSRARAQQQLACLKAEVRRLETPATYPVGRDSNLFQREQAAIAAVRADCARRLT